MGNMDEQNETSEQISTEIKMETEGSSHVDDSKHEHRKHKKKKKHKHKDKDKDMKEDLKDEMIDTGSKSDIEGAVLGQPQNGHIGHNRTQVSANMLNHVDNAKDNESTEILGSYQTNSEAMDMDKTKKSAILKHIDNTKDNESPKTLDSCQTNSEAVDMDRSDDNSGEEVVLEEKDKRKLLKRRQSYKEEKHALKKKLEETKMKVEEEINKYQEELEAKRLEYLSQLGELKLDEQYTSLSKRMDEVAELEQVLDRRLQQCTEQQREVEDLERFLDRRQQLCNSRESDLRRLDEELDTLHQELELDKERLERAGFDTSNIGNRKDRTRCLNNSMTSQWTNDEDDYIVKANLRKYQAQLKKTEENLGSRNEEITTLKEQVQVLETEKKKNCDKIRHLETQLSVALSQLSHKSTQSKDATIDKYKSSRTNLNHQRLNSAKLSINQEAQLRRAQKGAPRQSIASSRQTLMSVPRSSAGTSSKSDAGSHRPHSFMSVPRSSAGTSSKSDTGSHSPQSSEAMSVGTSNAYLNGEDTTSTVSNQRTVSSACLVM